MNKVILVINDPVRCLNCPIAKHIHMGGRVCGISNNVIDIDSKVRPDWCPLKEAPEKDEICYLQQWSNGYKKGWNDCVNYVAGE
jgi:hypothetical protein